MISMPLDRYHGSGKKSCETRLRAWTLVSSPENGLGLAVQFNLFLQAPMYECTMYVGTDWTWLFQYIVLAWALVEDSWGFDGLVLVP
jgi:hypothetical protein